MLAAFKSAFLPLTACFVANSCLFCCFDQLSRLLPSFSRLMAAQKHKSSFSSWVAHDEKAFAAAKNLYSLKSLAVSFQ